MKIKTIDIDCKLYTLEIQQDNLDKICVISDKKIFDNFKSYIEEDSCARLDEIESLIDWIKDL